MRRPCRTRLGRKRYLFISHDLSVIKHMSSRITVMYLGKVVEEAARDDLFRQPRHPFVACYLAIASSGAGDKRLVTGFCRYT